MTTIRHLYRRTRDACYRALIVAVGDPLEAEDLLSDAYLRALTRWMRMLDVVAMVDLARDGDRILACSSDRRLETLGIDAAATEVRIVASDRALDEDRASWRLHSGPRLPAACSVNVMCFTGDFLRQAT